MEFWPPARAFTPLAVLVSGGLDSGVLLAEALRVYPVVHPIYVRTGTVWEFAERRYLRRFLNAVRTPALRPLVELVMPVRDLYAGHWSLTGLGTPADGSPEDAVYLPGRNVVLLAKALLRCHAEGIPELATAPLHSNPFPDSTEDFCDGLASAVDLGVRGRVRVLRPYAAMGLAKADVLRRGASLPLRLTFSCIRPTRGRHCGACNKCGERRRGFGEAGLPDPTAYAAG